MKKKKITLTKEQYFLIKSMFLKVDMSTRSVLSNIKYEGNNKKLISTDGHIIRFQHMDLGKKDMVLDPKDFKLSEKAYREMYGKGTTTKQVSSEFEVSNYPEYERVTPQVEDEEELPAIGVDLDSIVLFCKTLPKDIHHKVKLKPMGRTKAIKIFGLGDELLGLIMPVIT